MQGQINYRGTSMKYLKISILLAILNCYVTHSMAPNKGSLQFLPKQSSENLFEFVKKTATVKQIALIYTHCTTLKSSHELIYNENNVFHYNVSDCKCLFHLTDKHKPEIIGISNIDSFSQKILCKVIVYYLNNGKHVITSGPSDKIRNLLNQENADLKEYFIIE